MARTVAAVLIALLIFWLIIIRPARASDERQASGFTGSAPYLLVVHPAQPIGASYALAPVVATGHLTGGEEGNRGGRKIGAMFDSLRFAGQGGSDARFVSVGPWAGSNLGHVPTPSFTAGFRNNTSRMISVVFT